MEQVAGTSGIAPWIQAGGVVAFAALVWLELRLIRPALDGLRSELARTRRQNVRVLEWVRAFGGTPPHGVPRMPVFADDDEEDEKS